MGNLFSFADMEWDKILTDSITAPLKGTKSIIENIGDGDWGAILGDNQDISTEALGNLGFNEDNKLVKNSDAIAGTIIGSILAAPYVAGAMGGSAGGAGAGAGGSAAGGAGATGTTGATAGGATSQSSMLQQGLGMMGKQQPQKKPEQQEVKIVQPPSLPSNSGALGSGLSYDELLQLFKKRGQA